jgi:hypothetical protein
LSFGYYSRNLVEVLSIPTGPDNFISPGDANQGQPTYFYPRRHWGVFAVKVPAACRFVLVVPLDRAHCSANGGIS